jgi:hypothetical protein
MAAYNKFSTFVEHLTGKVHDLFGTAGSSADTCKVYLSNTAPNAGTHAVKADNAEITNQNGYTAPVSVANVGTRSSGTFTMQGTSLVITASGGTVGPFQYVILYNDTPTSPADPLIAWWDYASAITLADGETFTIKFNGAAVAAAGDIFTLV